MPNNKKEPEDIFAGTEKMPKRATSASNVKRGTQPLATEQRQPAPRKPSKLGVYIIVILVIIILAGGLALAFSAGIFNKKVTPTNKNGNVNGATVTNEIVNIPTRINTNQPLDTDSDGLSDEEEKKLGTDINNPDTDSDGLSDREEVKVYKTDSLKKDTDGDGVSDGDEVKKGDNPLGAGKLLDLPKEIKKLENTNQ